MRFIIVFLIIVALVATFSYFKNGEGNSQIGENSSPAQESSQTKPSGPKPGSKSPGQTTHLELAKASVASSIKEEPDFLIDTHIIFGPKEGEIIEDTNKITFEWLAEISPKDPKKRISFETKVEGLDEKWISTSSQKRTVTFPPGPKEYTFLVRAKTKDLTDLTPAKRTFKINISPYFGKVKISNVKKPVSSKNYSKPSLITLVSKLGKDEKINISGWEIEGKRGKITIPQGIEKYEPYFGSVPGEDIFVKRGDKIYLSSSQNPLGSGKNFRPNKCFGWLTNYYDFPISFSKTCPKLAEEDYSHLDVCCQELIRKTGSCKKPDYSENIKLSLDSECTSYIMENFNYLSCFNKHLRDYDFLQNSWHIYLNRNIVATDICDTFYLFDQNGLFVDSYEYGKDVCK